MAIKSEMLDELLKDKDPKTIFSSEGLLGELKKALAERICWFLTNRLATSWLIVDSTKQVEMRSP
jgi:hypothetical protein